MPDGFTYRANLVLQHANQEAQRYWQEYIGTQHILLGLMKEKGVVAKMFADVNVHREELCVEVEKLVPDVPETVTMKKLPHTPRAKKVIEYAVEESRNLNHDRVGTVHILLGLLRERNAIGTQALRNVGLNLEEVREKALRLLEEGSLDDEEWENAR